MSAGTRIEWADASWQTISGCSKISAGCAHCYSAIMTRRLQAMGQKKYAAGFDKVVCHPESLTEPIDWKKPKRIFVNSMADTFHKDVPDAFIDQIWGTTILCQQHVFMFLTKRAERMYWFMTDHPAFVGKPRFELGWVQPNVWLGVTVESQAQLDRIEWLKKTPAAVRFISFEPLLGHVLPSLKGIDMVIVGAETGPGARHMNLEWAIALRELCKMAHVPFFMKKMSKGEPTPDSLNVHEFPVVE
jgi:protein gp37